MILATRQAGSCDAVEPFPIVTLLYTLVHKSIAANSVLAACRASTRVTIATPFIAIFDTSLHSAVSAVRCHASWPTSTGVQVVISTFVALLPYPFLNEAVSACSVLTRSGARACVAVSSAEVTLFACLLLCSAIAT